MRVPPGVRFPASIGLLLTAACSDHPSRPVPMAPSFDEGEFPRLSGSVLGPLGNVCNSLPESSALRVRVIDPANFAFAGGVDLTCPENGYAFDLVPGGYLLRVELPSDPLALGDLPWRTIGADPVFLEGENVGQDITVAPGAPLGGRVTFEGQPVPGVGLNLSYENAQGFGAALGSSADDGTWSEFFGRPMLLQRGVRLQAVVGCGNPLGQFFLGTRVVQAPPDGAFLFPTERQAIDCDLETAPAVAFSHARSRLVVTPMPGDIGGLSGELAAQFGAGWGVQLLAVGESPQHGSITFSQLFRGGLVVGIAPDVVLTGVDFGGYGDCGGSCRDFGLDARLSASATRPAETKTVTWRYSDAGSPDAVGLQVVQRSYDGGPGSAYVIFKLTFTNTSGAPLSFYPGVLMDWDVGNADFDAFDDVGYTERGGRLMYMTDGPEGPGRFNGTLVFGAPPAGNAVLTDFGQTPAELVQLVTGGVTIPSAEDPADHRYLHTVGPVSLAPQRKASIWIAVVSGENREEFFTNVDRAAADVGRSHAGPSDGDQAGQRTVTTTARVGRGVTTSADPRCKRGCGGE